MTEELDLRLLIILALIDAGISSNVAWDVLESVEQLAYDRGRDE